MKYLTRIVFLKVIMTFNISFGQAINHSETSGTNDSNSSNNDTLTLSEQTESLTNLVSKIANSKSVSNCEIGISGTESEGCRNFKLLKKIATINELVNLTENKNKIIACYAGWALLDTLYPNIKTIMRNFISDDKQLTLVGGCEVMTQNLSELLYYRYWNNVDIIKRPDDKLLLVLDSVIIYNENSSWELLNRALENRIYQEPFKTQISKLAFEKNKRLALQYLCKWYRAEYSNKIKIALVEYLVNTEFKYREIDVYYEIVDELLKFNDPEIRKGIIKKLKRDRYWENDKERFKYLLTKNYIFISEYE
jgi:hypothetical protein